MNEDGIRNNTANRRSTLTLPNGIKLSYGYDNANELTGLTYTLGTGTVGTMTYGYDSDGRIINRGGTFDITNLPAALTSASYDANNRLTKWGRQAVSYDANGNLVSNGKNTYTWNTRNQLTGISGGSTASFLYDALGRRQSKTISSTSTNFLYDGMNLEQELNGSTPTVNYLTGAGIDETFSRTDSSGTYNYLTDNLGSTLALTNSAGAISTSYSYEPYGNTTASGASSTNALQYTGRENDGTGLYYYRTRYYSPAYGRFISSDPLGFGGGLNTYSYADGNPTNYTDPTGLAVYVYEDQVVPFFPYYHLYLLLVPDNPQDFANHTGWQSFGNGQIWASLSAHPQHWWGGGNLEYTPNYAGNDWKGGSWLGILSAPCGVTDTQFINNLINAANSYKNNLPYKLPNPFTGSMASGKYNSDSFITGIIEAVGATAPALSAHNFPGYQNPIPLSQIANSSCTCN